MRAGKKQVAESGKTRPCIVYLKNLREEAEPAGGRLRKRDPRELQQLQQKRELALRETPRRVGRSETVVIDKKPLSRTRQAVAAKSPISGGDSPSPPPKATTRATTAATPASVMAKRRSTLVLGNSHQKLTGIGPRRGTQTETHATPKMFKQAVAKHLAPSSPPPTIAASRSRRSIKPNPKYASEDLVTPKYMASLAGEGSPVSGASRNRSQTKPMYAEMNDLLDLDEDNDDELADAAFNPQLHKSDEDDDEEFISDGEFEQELRLEKLPAAKRGRGRPPKANNVKTPSSAAATASSAGASNRVFHKLEANSGQGRTAPPSTMQQLRRTLAGSMARNNASMTADGGGGGGGGGGAKRKLEVSESESPVARKRLVVSSTSGSGQRSVPVVNGATKRSTTPSAHANISRPKVGGVGNTPRMQPQRSAGAVFKVNPATPTTTIQNATNSSTRSTRGGGAGGGSGSGAGAGAASEGSPKEESEATFTIVNIDDIMNQDDVLISRANTALAAAAARGGGGASKKLAKGRLRIKDILSTSNTIGSAIEKKLSSLEKSTPVSNNSSSSSSSQAAKRIKILASNSNSTSSGSGSGNATKPRAASQAVAATVHNQSAAASKPRPRILNAEMGKKTQPMKPLMSMGHVLCPTDVDTEEDDPDPDLDLDLDLDLDEPPASIVTRRTPRQASGPAAAAAAAAESGSAGNATASNKWSSSSSSTSRRKAPLTASTANARAEKRVTKLTDAHDEPAVFKKPGGSPQLRSKENQQQQQEQRDKEEASAKKETASTAASSGGAPTVLSSPQKYFPPETTIFSEEEGRLVKKITCYETWHVINLPTESPASAAARQQRTCLELALVKLANVAARLKVPSPKWSSKVTLYKVSPTLMQRQSMNIFTGDLNAYNIPEEDRHKYQPSCVLFRRTAADRAKSRVPYDRAIIFKNKCFYANIDGKQVNLLGAPESVVTIKEVEILLDIVDRLTLNSQLVEMVNTK